ncbi:hypothetical protein CDD83_7911 [Cordyceps sp. RAO-2017]|nr:hypothetical protein CDD83_7911 [Cordyceps sp. RAO-2017]
MGQEHRYDVAVVGLGSRGYNTWFKCLQGCPSIAVSAVCDSDEATIARFTSRHPDIPAYCSLESLLQAHKPKFVVLSVPNRLHLQCMAQLLAANIPILKEKPVAESLADFQELCQYPIKVGVAFQRRWQPRYVHFKNLLPGIGRILSVKATLAGKYDPAENGWRVADNQDLGIHMLDVMIWLFGRPSYLLGQRVDDGPLHVRDRESHVAIRWEPSKLVGQLYVSEVASEKEETLSVRGVLGSLHLRCDEITHIDARGRQTFHMTVREHKESTIQTMCQEFGDYVCGTSQSFSTSIAQMADTIVSAEAVALSFCSNALQHVHQIRVPAQHSVGTTQVNGLRTNGREKTKAIANGSDQNGQHENCSLSRYSDFNMPQRRFLLNTGAEIPGLGFGTRKPKKPRQTYEAVAKALAVGYRHIDTAFRYNNEDQVGEAVRDSGIPRKAVWITTKVDNSWHHRVAESVEKSLAALGLEYIDLLLMVRLLVAVFPHQLGLPTNSIGRHRSRLRIPTLPYPVGISPKHGK